MVEIFQLLPEHHGKRVLVKEINHPGLLIECKVYFCNNRSFYLLSNKLDGAEVDVDSKFREEFKYSYYLGDGNGVDLP